MADWTAAMGRTYEFWIVDPATWRDVRPLSTCKSCEITHDDSELMGSMTMEVGELIEEECYIREYMVVEQPPGSRRRERFCLGTHLVQTPSIAYDGKMAVRSLECYTPLIELRDAVPPVGYTVAKGADVSEAAAKACRDHCRAPVSGDASGVLLDEPLVANDDDTWLSFVNALLAKGSMHMALDEWGRIYFAPDRDAAALAPAWTYTDDNSSILMPEVEEEYDWYGIPNVYEAVLSGDSGCVTARAVNDAPDSPLSTVSRGREVVERDMSPDVPESATAADLLVYATVKLREASRVERTLTYSHGFNQTRVGDGVRLDYRRHALDARGKVVKRVIRCDTLGVVEETATYSESLWR